MAMNGRFWPRLMIWTVARVENLSVDNYYHIVFNAYAVFLDWKNGAE
jgi:hypothetical protein